MGKQREPRSPEHCAAIAAALRGRWAKWRIEHPKPTPVAVPPTPQVTQAPQPSGRGYRKPEPTVDEMIARAAKIEAERRSAKRREAIRLRRVAEDKEKYLAVKQRAIEILDYHRRETLEFEQKLAERYVDNGDGMYYVYAVNDGLKVTDVITSKVKPLEQSELTLLMERPVNGKCARRMRNYLKVAFGLIPRSPSTDEEGVSQSKPIFVDRLPPGSMNRYVTEWPPVRSGDAQA